VAAVNPWQPSIGSINTLFAKINKYQPAQKARKSFENTLNRANSTYLYQQQTWNEFGQL